MIAKKNFLWEISLHGVVCKINGDNADGTVLPEEAEGQVKRDDFWAISKVNFREGFYAVRVLGFVAKIRCNNGGLEDFSQVHGGGIAILVGRVVGTVVEES